MRRRDLARCHVAGSDVIRLYEQHGTRFGDEVAACRDRERDPRFADWLSARLLASRWLGQGLFAREVFASWLFARRLRRCVQGRCVRRWVWGRGMRGGCVVRSVVRSVVRRLDDLDLEKVVRGRRLALATLLLEQLDRGERDGLILDRRDAHDLVRDDVLALESKGLGVVTRGLIGPRADELHHQDMAEAFLE